MVVMLRGLAASSILNLFLLSTAVAKNTQYIYGTSTTGVTKQLAVDRTPALYTQDFGDCLGDDSLFDITRFDAAYFTDNSTVLFHLDGRSFITNESLLIHISMEAYGQNRFQMTFDPCHVNIYSLCPPNSSLPITAWAVFSVGPQQVGKIPDLAFTVPDFEGYVRLQIFKNSTRSEIGCFQASLTNGATMAYPRVISPILAFFVLLAMVASFAPAVYGDSIPAMRTHYAHSLSVMLVMETFQTIFFSGALQLNWPSMLVAWWSNFAWSAGQIYIKPVVRSVDTLTGISGNTSQVRDARSSVESVADLGSDLSRRIYEPLVPAVKETAHHLFRRQPYNASNPYDYTWSGDPVHPGVALPGTWTGFRGTLAALNMPAADAFTIGLIWLFILLAGLIFMIAAFKFVLEILEKTKCINKDKMAYFRCHWTQYTSLVILRALYVALAMIATLAFFQFSFGGSAGVKSLTVICFLALLLSIGGLATHAIRVRLRKRHYSIKPDLLVFVHGSIFGFVPCIRAVRMSTLEETELPEKPIVSFPFFRLECRDDDLDRVTVHRDEPYIKRFGWLTARYRKTKWWFFIYYLGYQLIRAALIGGGSATPKAQVYCLLVYDVVALFVVLKISPFEGRRNTALAVWMLSICKVLTSALSIAFLPALGLERITATIIGVIIIVIQGLLTIAVMILVILSVMSSYISLTRNREYFNPTERKDTRQRYLEHLEKMEPDIQISKAEKETLGKLKEAEMNALPLEPSFTVNSVRRITKIYDEEEDYNSDIDGPKTARSNSIVSTHGLPRGARAYRSSWSSQDFVDWEAAWFRRSDSGMANTNRSSSNAILQTFNEEDDYDYDVKEKSSLAEPHLGLSPRMPRTPASLESSITMAVQAYEKDFYTKTCE